MGKSAEQKLQENKDYRVLQAVKMALLNIIKDTTVQPGMRHPLSEQTIEGMRKCLALIYAREHEIADDHGVGSQKKPYYADEPQKSATVSIESLLAKKKKDKDSD